MFVEYFNNSYKYSTFETGYDFSKYFRTFKVCCMQTPQFSVLQILPNKLILKRVFTCIHIDPSLDLIKPLEEAFLVLYIVDTVFQQNVGSKCLKSAGNWAGFENLKAPSNKINPPTTVCS